MTDQPTFMPEPQDPDANGPDGLMPAWDPTEWPEMAGGPPAVDEPAVDEPEVDEARAVPDSIDNWARDAAPAAVSGPADAEAYVPFADRVPESSKAVEPGQNPLFGPGPTAHDNHLATYALFFGVVAVVATAVLYLWGAGLWWLDVVIGGAGVYYGFRGFNAAARGRATNRSTAVLGAVLGLVGALTAAAYLVVAALVFASAFR